MRDIVFISHANPEDNEFALWLTLRLASEGYPVWCDLAKLLGGEDFWKDIEDVLRQRTIKFLYILSRTSNQKTGSLQELAVAKDVQKHNTINDFVIPLHIDDLPYSDVNIELHRINSIAFENNWAKGLAQLLKKLDEDAVGKNTIFDPKTVNHWWREHFSSETGLTAEPETLLSNWFRLSGMPKKLFIHVFQPGMSLDLFPEKGLTQFPIRSFSNGLATFAGRDDFPNGNSVFWQSHSYELQDLLTNKHKGTFIDAKDTRLIITDLFRQSWENKFQEKGLNTYELASGDKCGYFVKDQIENDTISFNFGGLKGRRHVIGFKTINKEVERKRFWHFGISGRVFFRSFDYVAVNPHVIFSDDGKEIWLNKDKTHKAKMRQCSGWWNDDWRDRILAVMGFLSDEETIKLHLASDSTVEVEKMPVTFESPVTFHDPVKNDAASDLENKDGDEEEEEEEF
jgi:hypothetical protein